MTFDWLEEVEQYRGRAFAVEKVKVRLPDGRETHYDYVKHSGAVTLVPVDEQNRILFVTQYRIGVKGDLLELPAGTLEIDEDPEKCAAREVREETGMAASTITKLGEFYLAPGYSSEYMHVYLMTGLYPSPLKHDDDEFLQVKAIPVEEVWKMIHSNQFRDGKTLSCLLLAMPYLKNAV
ncbi:MAG: NUDIX hydrolase [Chloroflexi bacterium]|nr:NUDIX hydrolase [Chloroflexota bacterium]BCY17293.1 ADP-ribose pyrophosphatase [Leptolinea sp. HRD-7]